MTRTIALLLALAAAPALASQPGQPLDCSDWVFFRPGLSCEEFEPLHGGPLTLNERNHGPSKITDLDGKLIVASHRGWGYDGVHITEWDGAQVRDIAYLPARGADQVFVENACTTDCAGTDRVGVISFDPVRGTLIIPLFSTRSDGSGYAECPEGHGSPSACAWTAAISGFTTLYEIAQTYVPSAAGLTFRVPAMPEGMPAVDHFDTYIGEVTNPLDLSRAQPLKCAYPDQPPKAGDYLTLPEPPRPAPGHATYVLTAVTYGAERRAGRRTSSAGRLVGRDATALPTCVTKEPTR